MLKYDSIAELVNEAEKRGLKLSELVLKTQAAMTEKTEEEMFATMERSLQVMKESVQDGLDKDKRSASGLTGGDAYKLNEALKAGKNIAGHFFGNAMMKAVAVAQTNACMGRIVASPTAGSCGRIRIWLWHCLLHLRLVSLLQRMPAWQGRQAAVRQNAARQAQWRRRQW